ncbi:uncharacterized protein LOC112343275 [Selaginella moellendorffii]|uniref:uncharacterized protein LOC112343275 n=1 Tax=Selaginella moellendorffii TaxID=88036 RepID=UPI000D1CB90E|nr:uncharacterized protein LOC112343275 [Selaginella moellendorffii]|eukprot:XP_024522216.1 uncharacterized protein LOC112343275 [Selaginella moellendorffii]
MRRMNHIISRLESRSIWKRIRHWRMEREEEQTSVEISGPTESRMDPEGKVGLGAAGSEVTTHQILLLGRRVVVEEDLLLLLQVLQKEQSCGRDGELRLLGPVAATAPQLLVAPTALEKMEQQIAAGRRHIHAQFILGLSSGSQGGQATCGGFHVMADFQLSVRESLPAT